jgi:glycosyltransferase involved in cell wall biosynthesis
MSLEIIQKDLCVIISTYYNDDAISLSNAILSLLNQTLIPEKIILVVDGPISHELKAIANFFVNDKLIEAIFLDRNIGVGLARNKAIKNLKYKYLAFMDADDISRPDRFLILAKRILELNILDKDFLMGGYIEEYALSLETSGKIKRVPLTGEKIRAYSNLRNPFNHVTIILNRQLFQRLDGYRDYRGYEDYDLVLRALAVPDIYIENIPKVLVSVNCDNRMYGRRGGVKNILIELKFFTDQLMSGRIKLHFYLINIVLRFPIRVLPTPIRSIIYKKILR